MLTNDQRAHELALAMLPTMFERASAEATRIAMENRASDTITASVDIFDEYWNLYEAALDAFNKRFPE